MHCVFKQTAAILSFACRYCCQNTKQIHIPSKSILNESVFKLFLDNLLLSDEKNDHERRGGQMNAHINVTEIKNIYTKIKECQEFLLELHNLSQDSKDKDMEELIQQDESKYSGDLEILEEKLLHSLLPTPSTEDNDLILEVTAGAGGQEAMLFTKEMFNMYQTYITYKGWVHKPISIGDTELGGYRHASLEVSGRGAFQHLQHEIGVHRVQRVPSTESVGRMHTSTMAVSVLPKPSQVQVTINAKDIKIDTFRSKGAGGQSVNTTDSAVRITHLPTGIVSECQEERSQQTNKTRAMDRLRMKLFQKELDERDSFLFYARKTQLGSISRAERIRTYNFNQDRVSDHRIGVTLNFIRDFMSGGEALDTLISHVHRVQLQQAVISMCSQQKK